MRFVNLTVLDHADITQTTETYFRVDEILRFYRSKCGRYTLLKLKTESDYIPLEETPEDIAAKIFFS